jgi:hypothetical protein
MRPPIAAALLCAAAATVPLPAPAQPMDVTWRVVAGDAVVGNAETRFAVSCRRGDAGGAAEPTLVFRPPPGEDYGPSFEARLQISTAADAYRIDGATEIDSQVWRFAGDGGEYEAVEPVSPGASLETTLDRLRAGMNLVLGAEAFDRAQRYSLIGSNRAIGAVLAACD